MSWRERMNRLADRKMTEYVQTHVLRFSVDLYGTLKIKTPVDTGRARSNWHLDVGAPNLTLVEAGGDSSPNTSQYRVGQTVFISNNVPYIRRLNDGHSQQAPANFIQFSIDEAKARIHK